MVESAMIEFLQECESGRANPRCREVIHRLATELSTKHDIKAPEDLANCNANDFELETVGLKSLLIAAIAFAHSKWTFPRTAPPEEPEEEYEILDLSSPVPPFICPSGKDHWPRARERRRKLKNFVFQAAFQGCLQCVSHCLEINEVDPWVQSDNCKYTVLDWAEWGVQCKVDGADEVVRYLRTCHGP